MALAANLGVNPRKLYNALQDSSFMCECTCTQARLEVLVLIPVKSGTECLGN